MKPMDAMYFFLTAGVSVIAFFLVRFYYLVDEMRRDVKQLLIQESAKNEAMKNMRSDIEEIKDTINHHSKQLSHLELELAKIK
jgi:hypothetical protein